MCGADSVSLTPLQVLMSTPLTFMFGLKRFAPLTSADGGYLEVVLLGRVEVVDEQLRLLPRDVHRRLLPA